MEPVKIPGTRIRWTGLAGWLEAVEDLQARWHQAAPYIKAARLLYRSVTPEHIKACRNMATLEDFESVIAGGKRRGGKGGLRYPLRAELSRAELGSILVLVRNQKVWIHCGCLERRTKNARFDLAKMPDAVLEKLIQQHPSMELVEKLRAEKAARARMKDPGSWSPILRRVMGMETPLDRARTKTLEAPPARPSYSPQLSLF